MQPDLDSLEAIAEDLRTLPKRRRRAILAGLTARERDALLPLLDSPAVNIPEARAVDPALSPWLRERLGEGRGEEPGRLTRAAAAALREAAAGIELHRPVPKAQRAAVSDPLVSQLWRWARRGRTA